MKKGAKIALGIGCGLVLIGAIAIVVGIFALNYIEKRLDDSTKQFAVAGREYGAGTDKQGCIDEGMWRSQSAGLTDMSAAMQNIAFVDSCLETSRTTAGFCEGVPSFWSMKEGEWGVGQCRRYGVDPEKTGCVHVAKRKHQFCSKPF